jgi:CO/xanthine dehydrogenase Mo-binding subunit
MLMALGYALCEELVLDENGQPVNAELGPYWIYRADAAPPAVLDATGVAIDRLPLTPERVPARPTRAALELRRARVRDAAGDPREG